VIKVSDVEWTEEELEIIEASHYDEDVFEAAWECDVPVESVEEAYSGHHQSDKDFTQDLLESCGDLPKLPHYIHIDWESTARDIMMDYCEHDRHYFRHL
jgi:antirestriction protein